MKSTEQKRKEALVRRRRDLEGWQATAPASLVIEGLVGLDDTQKFVARKVKRAETDIANLVAKLVGWESSALPKGQGGDL